MLSKNGKQLKMKRTKW